MALNQRMTYYSPVEGKRSAVLSVTVSPDLMPDVKESPGGVGQVETILQRRLSPASPRLVLNEALRLDQLLLQDHQARHQILPHPSAPLKITIKVQVDNKIIWDISPEGKHHALSAVGTTPEDLKEISYSKVIVVSNTNHFHFLLISKS